MQAQGELVEPEDIPANPYEPKWDEKYIGDCETYASLGANLKQMASIIGVTQKTFHAWLSKRPDLKQAIQRGQSLQTCSVSQALLNRALGKTKITEEKIHTQTINGTKVVQHTKITKQLAPDVAAQKIWLEAHDPDKWGGSAALKAAERAKQIESDNAETRPTTKTLVGAVKQLMSDK